MRGKTDSEIIQENMCLENTTFYSDPEKWLPTQQGFQLKEAPKNPSPFAEHKVWQIQNGVICANQGFQQYYAILKNRINCISFNIYDLFQRMQIVPLTDHDYQLLFPIQPQLSFLNKPQREMLRLCWSWGRGTPAKLYLLSRPRTVCEMIHRVIQGNWTDALHKATLAFPLKSKYRFFWSFKYGFKCLFKRLHNSLTNRSFPQPCSFSGS